MSERDPLIEQGMINASKQMEKAWIIVSDASNYTEKEYLDAKSYIKEQLGNFLTLVGLEEDGDDPNVSHSDLELVLQGLYHHRKTLPLNVSIRNN